MIKGTGNEFLSITEKIVNLQHLSRKFVMADRTKVDKDMRV